MVRGLKRHYHTLGLREGSTRDEVRRAFRRLTLETHPDRNGNTPESNRRFKAVLKAYRALMRHAPAGPREAPPEKDPVADIHEREIRRREWWIEQIRKQEEWNRARYRSRPSTPSPTWAEALREWIGSRSFWSFLVQLGVALFYLFIILV